MPYRPALFLLCLLAFGLRAFGLGTQSLWLDEVDAIAMAAEPVAAQLRKLTAIGENGPLYFLLYKGWIALAGTSEFGARFLSCAASTVAVPLIAAVADRLTGSRRVALGAAALAATSPYYVWYGQDAKMYPLFAALTLGAQHAFLRAWQTGERRSWLAYVVASSLALYVHLFAALQIAANTAAGLVWLWEGQGPRVKGQGSSGASQGELTAGKRRWVPFLAATAALVLPYLPLAVWQAPVLLRGASVGYRPTSVPDMLVALGEQLTWHVNPPPDRRLLVLVLAAAAVGLWRLAMDSPRAAATVGLWLGVPVLLVYAVQFTVPVFRDRYLIPLLAPLLVLFARAVVGRPAPLGGLVAAFLVGSWAYGLANRPPNPDYRSAAAMVHAALKPGERVGFLAEYTERPFAHYYRRLPGQPRYEKAALPYTNYPGMTDQQGLAAVATSLRGGEGLWIVRFEDWLWDSRGLTTHYLRNRGAMQTVRRELNGVSVERWQVP